MLINFRDVPVAVHFTKSTLKHEFYFDVGIGKTDFDLTVNTQQHNGKAKVNVYYGSTVIGNIDWSAGLIYIIGEVTTLVGQTETSFIKVVIEGDITENDHNWLLTVISYLKCDVDSPAPKPYRVKNNTSGTAVINEGSVSKPAWVTEVITTNFRDPTTTIFGQTTTVFDPGESPFSTVMSTSLPTGGDGTGSGPPGPTTTYPPGMTTTPLPTAGFTSGITPTFPPTAEVTTEPTPEPTTSPTEEPFTLEVKGSAVEANNLNWVIITDANKDSALTGAAVINNLSEYQNEANRSKLPTDVFIQCDVAGGSESYRIKYEGIVPGIFPLRNITSTSGTIPTAEENSLDIINNTNYYKDLEQYKLDTRALIVCRDNTVRCLGSETTGTQKLKIIADDGYTTLEQELTWNRSTYIDTGSKVYRDGSFVVVKIPTNLAADYITVFDFEPTQDGYNTVSFPGGTVIFYNSKQNIDWFDYSKSEQFLNYKIEPKYVTSKVRCMPDGKGAGLNVTQYLTNSQSSSGWFWCRYYVESPIVLGVLKVSLKNKATSELNTISKMLLWWSTPSNGYPCGGYEGVTHKVSDYSYYA